MSRRKSKNKRWWEQKRRTYGICVPVCNEQDSFDMNDSTIQIRAGGTPSPMEGNIFSNKNYKENEKRCGSNSRDRKMRERKERKRLMNATIPCRFYHSKNGCWRGDKCMFLHLDNVSSGIMGDYRKNSNQMKESDMDIDLVEDLSNQIRSKAKVSVPAKISFGKRRR